jgi:fructokinase
LTTAATRRVGIDLGGTKIEGVVLEPDGREVTRRRIATERERGYEHIVARTASLVQELLAEAPGARAVGIGTPGAVSARDGTMKNSNTTCLNGRPLLADLRAALPVAVRLENDANCFALAEAGLGAGQGHDLVFGVILGTGVGGGIVYRGTLWSGPQHIAGEWGHHRIDPAGPACYCGQRGCVETLLSGPALERAHRNAGGPALDAASLVTRAAAGDAIACGVLERYLDVFGRALANVLNVLDPDAVVLGGGLSGIEALYDRGRDAVARYVFSDELRTPILRPALGDAAGVIGAALLVGAATSPEAP